MRIKITGDSTFDLPESLRKQWDIDVIGVIVSFEGKDYRDGIDITADQLMDAIDRTGSLPKTAALNCETYKEFFQEYLDKGYDAVIHFSFSSEMSAMAREAAKAAAEMKNIYTIDTKSLSSGSGLLALYGAKLAKSGKYDAETIVKKCTERVAAVQASFVLDKLTLLHKGGRCSMVAAFGANLFKIKPRIQVIDGQMKVTAKYRGKMENVVTEYVKDTLAQYNTPDPTICFITYTSVSPEILANVHKELEASGKFEAIVESRTSATITSHCGRNTIGVLYLNDGKH